MTASVLDSTTDLDSLLKRLHLANARRVWRDLVQRAEKEQWSHGQLLQTLFEEEVAHRRGTRLRRAVNAAAFPFLRTVEEFDFTYQSTLRLTTIGSLLAPDFVTEGRSVIFLGRPGRGKTHLAIAIAYRALQNGFDALFTTAVELIDELSLASREGRMREALASYVRPHVLVVDEVGYLSYGADAANVLYHVVNERHIRRRAMVFTTNKHPKRWGGVLHDDDLADAIVDRILERGRLLRLDGPSVRTKHIPADELAGDEHDPGSRRISGIGAAEFPERTLALSARRRNIHGSNRQPCTGYSELMLVRRGTSVPARSDSMLSRCGLSVAGLAIVVEPPARDASIRAHAAAMIVAEINLLERTRRERGRGYVTPFALQLPLIIDDASNEVAHVDHPHVPADERLTSAAPATHDPRFGKRTVAAARGNARELPFRRVGGAVKVPAPAHESAVCTECACMAGTHVHVQERALRWVGDPLFG